MGQVFSAAIMRWLEYNELNKVVCTLIAQNDLTTEYKSIDNCRYVIRAQYHGRQTYYTRQRRNGLVFDSVTPSFTAGGPIIRHCLMIGHPAVKLRVTLSNTSSLWSIQL